MHIGCSDIQTTQRLDSVLYIDVKSDAQKCCIHASCVMSMILCESIFLPHYSQYKIKMCHKIFVKHLSILLDSSV